MLVTLVKIGLCGLTSYMFLKRHTQGKVKDGLLLILSTAYALNGYNMAYMANIMWLDAVYFAPLVCMGIDKLVREGKIGTYIVTMALTIIFGYYTGCMVGIFSAIYFMWLFIKENKSLKEMKENKKKFLFFFVGAILALGIASIILIPVLTDLQGTRTPIGFNTFFTSETTCSLEELLSRFWIGSYNSIDQFSEGLPNLYTSIFVITLVFLYFTNREVSKRSKIITGITIGILIITHIFHIANTIMHGFNPPANFPYRFSFMFILFLIIVSTESLIKLLKKIDTKQIGLAIGVSGLLGIFLIIRSQITISQFGVTILFFAIYIILFVNRQIKGFNILMYIILCLELILNTHNIILQTEYESRTETLKEIETVQEIVDQAKEKQDDGYRLEKTFSTYDVDPMLYGYNGITHYSSNTKIRTLAQYEMFGYPIDWLMIKYNRGNTVFADSFYNIKYIIDEKDNLYTNYPIIQEVNGYLIRENKNTFPFSYLVNEEIKDFNVKNKNAFENQNEIYQVIANTDEKILEEIKIENENLINVNKNEEVSEIFDFYQQIDLNKEASINYTFSSPGEGPIYMVLEKAGRRGITIVVNGNEVEKDAYIEYKSGVYKLGDFSKNEKIEVKLKLKNRIMAYKEACFYQEDISKVEELKNSLVPMQITEFKNTKIKGNINVTEENATLYLGVPYEEGWTVKVNGKKVETQKVLYDQMVIDLSRGDHEIEMIYFPRNTIIRKIVSMFTILITIILIRKQKKKEKE